MRDILNLAAVKVQLDEIQDLHFPHEDVLFTEAEKNERARMLFLVASGLGINKAELIFEDLTGVKTTVGILLQITETDIYLENNIRIPINRISALKSLKSIH